MNSKEWRNWIDGVERIGTVGLGPMRELLADFEAAEVRAERLDRALQSLTPGGSEFVHDPDRCVAFVRDVRDGEMRALKAAVKRAQEAEARAEALEVKLLRVVRGEFGQICSYCGWESKRDGTDWEDLQQHIRECSKHPMRALEAECREERAQRQLAEDEVGRLRKLLSEWLEDLDATPVGEMVQWEHCSCLPAAPDSSASICVACKTRAALMPPEAQGREGSAALDVLAERRRQITEEGWNEQHDDQHSKRELSTAAACYCLGPSHVRMPGHDTPAETGSVVWPWNPEWWKPKNRRRDLVRAAALIIAEIDRLDRYAASGGERRAAGEQPQGGAGEGK